MRPPRPSIITLLVCALLGATIHVHASPVASDALSNHLPAAWAGSWNEFDIVARDGDDHHHGAPIMKLNETEVLMGHGPTPPSYWTVDVEESGRGHAGLMVVHGVLMSAAFFVALPAGIAMRSVKHAWHAVPVCLFYALCILGCSASALYTKMTPNMYEGQKHSRHGYFIILAGLSLSIIDLMSLLGRVVAHFRSGDHRMFGFKGFWRTVILGREELAAGSSAEYAGLVAEPEEYEYPKLEAVDQTEPLHVRRNQAMQPLQMQDLDSMEQHTMHWANDVHRHSHARSAASDRTFVDIHSPQKQYSDDTLHGVDHDETVIPKSPLMLRVGRIIVYTIERALVFAGFVQLLSGIVVYTGGCRENYVNGCLAHLIKGGIFWCYGLLTFARFLGSFSEAGWAWNHRPSGSHLSAEFIESLVIFTYGITNTWMERFGANPGDPFTTKQLQHISIAVMFWFAGLIGMGIESKRVQKWLAASASSTSQSASSSEPIAEPPSYSLSFNPFPALVIGVTGAAMSAHAQRYVFQVQIHALWGYLLVAFAVLRCLTYFFLWLGPPRSVLPSRPPTEALGSFFLACGGLTFIFSTEELTFAAMRHGRDDVMMFLNLAVALTCFAFCWTFCVVAFKGWLKSRTMPSLSHRSAT